MFGAIVLRDVPKKEARIDLTRHELQGGFRGYGAVPPGAWHYVSVKVETHHAGFWCYLKPQQVVVKIFDDKKGFAEVEPDIQAHYSSLALSGAMGAALITYPHAQFGPWFGLVNHIPEENFPPQLGQEDSGSGSRFDKALLDTHAGDGESLLAEFQYAFVSWLVSQDTARADEVAFERWRHLVLSAYNAGERRIGAAGDLFPKLVATLLRQFDLLPDEWFGADSFLTSGQAGYMAEDMIDTGVPEIVDKGRTFADYLSKRRSR